MSYGAIMGCGLIVSIIFIALGLAFPIASYVIAFENYDAVCSQEALIPLPKWLIINGSVDFAYTIYFVLYLITLLIFRDNTGVVSGISFMSGILALIYSMWLIAWNVVGGVSLFRDSMECLYNHHGEGNTSLWAMTLAMLIWQWMGLIRNCSSYIPGKSGK